MEETIHIHSKNPSQFLIDNIDLLPRGSVLDVAMGSGRNSVYMASMGFQVEGIDISEEAIDAAKKLAHDNNVKINAHIVNLERETFIKKNRYDVIVCFNFLQRSLIPAIKEGIRPGGVIVYETYIVDQARFGRPTNPEYLLKHNELLDLFKEFRCLRYHEGIYSDKKAVAGIIAKKEEELI